MFYSMFDASDGTFLKEKFNYWNEIHRWDFDDNKNQKINLVNMYTIQSNGLVVHIGLTFATYRRSIYR